MLADSLGIERDHIFILKTGDVLELAQDHGYVVGSVPTGSILVDGLGVGDVGNVVLHDRQHLAEDGILIVVLTLERGSNMLLAGPDIATGLLSFIILKEVPSVLTLVGIVGTLLGLRFIIFPVKEEGGKSKISGYIFAFGALICMAVSTVMIKPVLNDISTVTVTIYRLLFGGIALLFYTALTGQTGDYLLPFKDKPFRKTYFSVMSLVAIGGFWLSIEAFKNINLITASALMTLEPLFILLIMILFYRYKPLKNELFGIIITLIGVLMIGYGEIL